METINTELFREKRKYIRIILPTFVVHVNYFHLNSISLIMNLETAGA